MSQRIFSHSMEAVVIYDELDVASRAIARLDSASRSGEEITHWGLKWWRMEVLNIEPAAQEALAESMSAHLIVLALHDQLEIPSMLLRWLDRWASRRQVQDAALAVFDGASGDTLSLAAAPELSDFATRHGLSLIVDEGKPTPHSPRTSSPGLKGLVVDPLMLSPGLQAFGGSRRVAQHRDWGIND